MIEREPPIPFRRALLRRGSTARRLLIIGVILLFVLLLSLRGIATFWTDYLWFSSVDLTSVWRTLIFTRVVLVLVAAAVAFALLWLNLLLADRLSPRRRLAAGSPDEELVERFQDWVEPRIRKVRIAVAAIFGVLIGLGAGAWWRDYLLFRHGESFGITDPVFNNDLSLYLFRVPFYRDLFGWFFQFFLIATLVVAAVHYLNGGIQIQPGRPRVAPGVKVHLSVLLAILALLKAVAYWLDRFDLLYSERGAAFGATFTDIKAQLPALNLLIGISLVAAILLLVNIRFRGWTLPAVAVGLWLATSIIVGGIIPAAVQRFSVQPDEINKELPYIARNIGFTRDAYDLSDVQVREFAASPDLDAGDLEANPGTLDNIRLWDPSVLQTTYRQLQVLRPFYQFEDVDVDRYDLEGDLTQLMLSARELDEANIPGTGWVNRHLVFTHGFGAVVSPANQVTVEGQPSFLVKDIRPDIDAPPELQIDQPRIYFGEGVRSSNFVIVGTKEKEVDFPLEVGAESFEFTSYDGEGGVPVGGIFRRAAFALRFGDVNTLISGQITSDSRVLMFRNLLDRVSKVAPFLHTDADPYLVTIGGRLLWVVDLYTVTDRYPYSTPAFTGRLSAARSGLPNDFNYIRNSVKATVDAFDGTMTFYVVDRDDPVIASYRNIFPDLFIDQSEMPDGLPGHLRYPEDLFRVQSDLYTEYHVTDPRVFFNQGDLWQIARDPSTTQVERLCAAASEAIAAGYQ
ncbi:MAG: UPF0182 family protein, partial [Acidimicrobiia bacterium]